MLKPKCLLKGDKVAIVSLSLGILGEPFVQHELDLGLKRLREYGLEPIVMTNALKGIDYLKEHPFARAQDLKEAFLDNSIKAIICSIGGDDTYLLYPYLLEDEEFLKAVKNNPKIFTGFSDTTINHLMFSKLGLETFYGPNLLVDLAELDHEMLPYTKMYFEKLFLNEKNYFIESSNVWYSDRENYSPEQIDVSRICHEESRGYELLNGTGIVTGELYGGCLESIYECMHGKSEEYCKKYEILPSEEDWNRKILFLETSDEKSTPQKLEEMLLEFKKQGIFERVKGLIIGKPIDEVYYEEYKEIYRKVFQDLETPVLYNVNFGHSVPRTLIPYGAKASVDYDLKTIEIIEPIFALDDL